MELHYRGATYNHVDPTVEMTDTPAIVHYRGAIQKVRQAKATPAQPPTGHLKYRGAWVH